MTRRKMLGGLAAGLGWLLTGLGFPSLAQTVTTHRRKIFLPPAPKWDRSVDGLGNLFGWAAEFETSLMPSDTVFPREGEVWEVLRDCQVRFVVSPFPVFVLGNPFHSCLTSLDQGERVRIAPVDSPTPVTVNFQPVRYHQLEERIIPADIRTKPEYRGYWLTVKTVRTVADFQDKDGAFFNEYFRKSSV